MKYNSVFSPESQQQIQLFCKKPHQWVNPNSGEILLIPCKSQHCSSICRQFRARKESKILELNGNFQFWLTLNLGKDRSYSRWKSIIKHVTATLRKRKSRNKGKVLEWYWRLEFTPKSMDVNFLIRTDLFTTKKACRKYFRPIFLSAMSRKRISLGIQIPQSIKAVCKYVWKDMHQEKHYIAPPKGFKKKKLTGCSRNYFVKPRDYLWHDYREKLKERNRLPQKACYSEVCPAPHLEPSERVLDDPVTIKGISNEIPEYPPSAGIPELLSLKIPAVLSG